MGNYYISVKTKFWMSHAFASFWTCFAIYISLPWIVDLGEIFTLTVAAVMISGIAYIPGYLNAFLVFALLLDKQPVLKDPTSDVPITILIACRDEEAEIANTLTYIQNQQCSFPIHVVIVDNGSSDRTVESAQAAIQELNLNARIVHEEKPGKFHALNKGLQYVHTELVITLDADTLLHPKAIQYLVSRMLSSPDDVCAVGRFRAGPEQPGKPGDTDSGMGLLFGDCFN